MAALVSLHEPAPAVAEPGDGEDGESENGVASVLSVTEHFNWHPIIEMNKDIYSTVWWVTGEGAGFAMRANSRLVFRWLNNKRGVHGRAACVMPSYVTAWVANVEGRTPPLMLKLQCSSQAIKLGDLQAVDPDVRWVTEAWSFAISLTPSPVAVFLNALPGIKKKRFNDDLQWMHLLEAAIRAPGMVVGDSSVELTRPQDAQILSEQLAASRRMGAYGHEGYFWEADPWWRLPDADAGIGLVDDEGPFITDPVLLAPFATMVQDTEMAIGRGAALRRPGDHQLEMQVNMVHMEPMVQDTEVASRRTGGVNGGGALTGISKGLRMCLVGLTSLFGARADAAGVGGIAPYRGEMKQDQGYQGALDGKAPGHQSRPARTKR